MSVCAPFQATGPAGIADALRKVDCLASDATALSFGRLFGENGAFRTALTIMLTLYVALIAINLLTGRSTLRLSTLTPRMMTMGLVITFVTSWIAYQSVIWNLAVGAPDEIAGVLVGTKESATMIFAQRLDAFFNVISEAAAAIPAPSPAAVMAAPTSALASPASVLSIASVILLLGTVGVLVACRLALAALLILGPVFIVLALFEGTRGLFEGWLKSVAMFAFVPLLTVLLGSGALLALDPMIADLGAGGPITMRLAMSILIASIIYLALMILSFKVAGTLTNSWRLSKAREGSRVQAPGSTAGGDARSGPVGLGQPSQAPLIMASERVRATILGVGTDISNGSSDRSLSSHTSLSTATHSLAQLGSAAPVTAGFRHSSYISHRLQKPSPKLVQGPLQ